MAWAAIAQYLAMPLALIGGAMLMGAIGNTIGAITGQNPTAQTAKAMIETLVPVIITLMPVMMVMNMMMTMMGTITAPITRMAAIPSYIAGVY